MSRLVKISGFLSLVFIAFFAMRCSDDQIVEMETLERDLLLTWVALERGDGPRIAEYNAATQKDWLLVSRLYGNVPMKPALHQSAARVDLWMLNLRNSISYGQPGRAMMAINLMQNELRVLRPQFGMDHPADHLYDFYYQWQDVVAASNDPMMCLLEWKEYEERFARAAQSWTVYVGARPRFSDTLFPGYGQNAGEAEAAGVAITNKLEQFATILDQADHTLAAEPSRIIEDLFFDYLAVVTAYSNLLPTETSRLQ